MDSSALISLARAGLLALLDRLPERPRILDVVWEEVVVKGTGLERARSRVPDPTADPLAQCARFEAELAAAGGFDLVVLGLGADGHVAYNLPGPPDALAHVVELPEAPAVRALLDGPEDPRWPCTLLRTHPDLDVLLTPEAAGQGS